MVQTLFRLLILSLLSATPALAQVAPETPIAEDERSLSPLELLGKRVFEDVNLSEPRGQACASCHEPGKAFQGNFASPIAALARGAVAGRFGNRNTPSLSYMSFSPAFGFVEKKDESGKVEMIPAGGQFWDGRAKNLKAQFEGPLLNPVEMNNPSKHEAVQRIKSGAYASLVATLFGADVFAKPDEAFDKIADAVVAFESTERFHPFASRFDLYLQGKEKLSRQELRGFALFKDPKKGNCLACHAGKEDSKNPKDWLFTDFSYDNLGLPRNKLIPANAKAEEFDLGLCKQAGLAALAPKDTKIDNYCGAFKVPTLRNVAITGPYMHNGVFTSLRDAVKFYATRDTNPENWYGKGADGKVQKFDDLPAQYHDNVNVKEAPYDRKPGQKPRLNDRDIDALVAFLGTLTDGGKK